MVSVTPDAPVVEVPKVRYPLPCAVVSYAPPAVMPIATRSLVFDSNWRLQESNTTTQQPDRDAGPRVYTFNNSGRLTEIRNWSNQQRNYLFAKQTFAYQGERLDWHTYARLTEDGRTTTSSAGRLYFTGSQLQEQASDEIIDNGQSRSRTTITRRFALADGFLHETIESKIDAFPAEVDNGRVIETDANGHWLTERTQTSPQTAAITQRTYDAEGRLLDATTSLEQNGEVSVNTRQVRTFDASGNLQGIAQFDSPGAGLPLVEKRRTEFTYDCWQDEPTRAAAAAQLQLLCAPGFTNTHLGESCWEALLRY